MKKVFDWTVGSFFRTIGRTIAFLVMAALLYYILSYNDISFGIKDLFFTHVNASEQITKWSVMYTDINRSTAGTSATILSNTNADYTTTKFYWPVNNTNVYDYQGGWVIIPFTLNVSPKYVSDTTTSATEDVVCNEWRTNTSISSSNYYCYSWNHSSTGNISDFEMLQLMPTTSIKAKLYTKHNNTSYNVNCIVETSSLKCPINYGVDYMDYIQFETNVSYGGTFTQYYKLDITNFVIVEFDGTNRIIDAQNQNTQAITNQTQQQQQQHQETMNSSTTDAENNASSFFGNFTVEDQGGLSAIVTAPLNTIRSLLSSSCTNLVLPLPFVNEDLTLPCLAPIYSEHFGAFFTLYQTIILGIIAYRCIMSIFFDIKGFTNPNDDRIEVMDL